MNPNQTKNYENAEQKSIQLNQKPNKRQSKSFEIHQK
jgi:hypothetical protein